MACPNPVKYTKPGSQLLIIIQMIKLARIGANTPLRASAGSA